MKTSKIYVGKNGATLALSSGAHAVAVYPAQKGETKSYLLLETGQLSHLTGSRIDGKGVARYLAENCQFEPAEAGNAHAEVLADLLDMREGTERVRLNSIQQAARINAKFNGQRCTFVPFDPDRKPVTVEVQQPIGYTTSHADLASGFSSGAVNLKFGALGSCCSLADGWILGPDESLDSVPRLTGYGGVIEHAVFTIVNCGFGSLQGPKNLELGPTDVFPRGSLTIKMACEDLIQVGVDALDLLAVKYIREGTVVYSRGEMPSLKLGDVIGAIAAVFVRVGELDAQPVKKPRAKKVA